MTELNLCPFCGGEAELDFAERNFVFTDKDGNPMNIGFFYTVKCCDEICGYKIGIYKDVARVIEVLNRMV